MAQIQHIPQKSVGYYFLKSKDVHIENGSSFITFFARLTREILHEKEGEKQTEVQTVWVKIDEVQLEQASEKVKAMPNCMQRYELTQNVFYNLYQLSKHCPKELFFVTPFHSKSQRENFIT
ncbi:hypothetical protein ACSFXN_06275 [Planococcus sp. 1R117A]|uniref:hypothetical protein n=1 Tax=Planococcus sp. 1R117A TaxID=3447020 RepID=UPI003EDB8A03